MIKFSQKLQEILQFLALQISVVLATLKVNDQTKFYQNQINYSDSPQAAINFSPIDRTDLMLLNEVII